MLMKLGFIISVLIFGGSMFVIGATAPEEIQQAVSTKTNLFIQKLPLSDLLLESEKITPGISEELTSNEAKDDSLPPVQYSLLELPTILPEGGSYAIELDMTLSLASINEWHSLLKNAQYLSHEIPVIGPDNEVWTVVAAGTYSTPADAKQHRLDLLQDVPQSDRSSLRIILLPSPEPSSNKEE